ncbi:hypothetical protein BD413DRAFT_480398 [Trametes elegans]|nr:hypothetical protein BD413DRAFT_480398 [Trametes elegans]
MTAFLGYEYLVTFDREVALFWWGRFTGASLLFLLNRYLPLLVVMLDLCQSVPMSGRVIIHHLRWCVTSVVLTMHARRCTSFVGFVMRSYMTDELPSRCASFVYVTGIASVLQYIPWAAFSALRVFALSGRHWPLAIVILLLSAIPIVRYRWLVSLNDPAYGCVSSLNMSADLVQHMLFVLNLLQLTFAMLSFYEPFLDVSYVTIFTEPCVTAVRDIILSRLMLPILSITAVLPDCTRRVYFTAADHVSGVNLTVATAMLGSLGSTILFGGEVPRSSDSFDEYASGDGEVSEVAEVGEKREIQGGEGQALGEVAGV